MTVESNSKAEGAEGEIKLQDENLEDITPNKDGGVLKKIIKEGDNTEEDRPASGDEVSVHYVGTLLNGEQFDSSRDRGSLFQFKLGKGQVIKAWDLGVATMRRGEVCQLICKPEYAYGRKGKGKIPPDATLVFEVELFDWKGEDLTEDKDGGVIMRIQQEGEGEETPIDGSSVQVHVVGEYNGKVFDERDVNFTMEDGNEHGIVDGVIMAIKNMHKGEKVKVDLKPKYAFRETGNQDLGIPGDANVTYTVTLNDFEKGMETWEMDTDQKIEAAIKAKARGTTKFKSGAYQDAIKNWTRITSLLEYASDLDDDLEKKEKWNSVKLAGFLNLAMAYLKTEEYLQALKNCEKALELDVASVKAYFRRAQAQMGMNNNEVAKKDLEKVLELEPTNKAAKNQLTICEHKIKQYRLREKKTYGNMFAKFADQDAKAEERRRIKEDKRAKEMFKKAGEDARKDVEEEVDAEITESKNTDKENTNETDEGSAVTESRNTDKENTNEADEGSAIN
ncbi:peptidyl-prolyl cis-trans isomerase FKBP5-like [Anneissia japonica]|uniref:peptidyl-prolyl cis-trans isomerase FKBP5-like n=1 Tax=Anneissia japonica TaxID=1529436 RepID=UPI0014256D65|nr:peptidyl-prolyl cis-trans isomerase FKBP5-like [Anneissia japonica]XP_033100052.1 peptidyl-prolyl cis-trans isomerase FKBP5-like [Anneissia japonica]XP_033100118.1 peptidyl-prolyl cis-trans isomerase FKBP5-like [Anneissia japonica]XP_033100191.1 peptidyl-prolyl cis-trans isomerase FKBP5-like [Anneissia japonica]XP_033100260.1 peptidyl-prolyl cis-trans isomerase FKBP5-like [Anneissia japonica]